LVFADYTELVAYDKTGIKWRTERLAYDSFKITEVTDRTLRGEFFLRRVSASGLCGKRESNLFFLRRVSLPLLVLRVR